VCVCVCVCVRTCVVIAPPAHDTPRLPDVALHCVGHFCTCLAPCGSPLNLSCTVWVTSALSLHCAGYLYTHLALRGSLLHSRRAALERLLEMDPKAAQLKSRNLSRYMHELRHVKRECERRLTQLGGPDYRRISSAENRRNSASMCVVHRSECSHHLSTGLPWIAAFLRVFLTSEFLSLSGGGRGGGFV
jgi:hypothetical protein